MISNNLALVGFADVSLAELDNLTHEQLDKLSFGVVGFDTGAIVERYNATEARLAGLQAHNVIGSHFFLSTAQCMNNFMVAQRFIDEPELDCVIDFRLTFRMRPTPVRLRLLKNGASSRQYILIEWLLK
jgi:photoactive yellow protein